jgi:hypothetical protein
MITLQLLGEITSEGALRVELPSNLPPGNVRVTLEIADDEQFTDAELRELLEFNPRSGSEVIAAGLVGGWEHKGITDPVEWVENERRKRRERSK